MAVIFGLPMVKFGGLVVRTLTKPLAKVVKSRSKVHPGLNAVCNSLGQQQHRLTIKFHMGFRGIEKYKIKDIPTDQAVDQGADLIGELMIFSVAVGVASYEYARSSAKSKDAERKQEELKLKAERVRVPVYVYARVVVSCKQPCGERLTDLPCVRVCAVGIGGAL